MEQNRSHIKLSGIVERITYHNPENGWSIIKVRPFDGRGELVAVVIFQLKVFAGATMDFFGEWVNHPKFGEQFKAHDAVEKKPATTAALEKYLGSGLIRGVGPVIAKRIVKHFKGETLAIFESDIHRLKELEGIAEKKLMQITTSWNEHKTIRDIVLFLQEYEISTMFAVKIFKTYGKDSIDVVKNNPYQLAVDIFGIGFFSADKIALKLGIHPHSIIRVSAAIKHILSSARESGHCFLFYPQIIEEIQKLLSGDNGTTIHSTSHTLIPETTIHEALEKLLFDRLIIKTTIYIKDLPEDKFQNYKTGALNGKIELYYSKSLFFDEKFIANFVKKRTDQMKNLIHDDNENIKVRIHNWVESYCKKHDINLSDEQSFAVKEIAQNSLSILTGGPGCGKTTTTRVLAQLLRAMGKRVTLCAPTGRASQRMSEVMKLPAKTIHRTLEFAGGGEMGFKRNENNPLEADFIIIDETSMLDVTLTASLLKAISDQTSLLFIGDPDQLPAVGAGNVLSDLIASGTVKTYRLTKIFRQASASQIITNAHKINKGEKLSMISPFAVPDAFTKGGVDCLFIDSEELTLKQLDLFKKTKRMLDDVMNFESTYLIKNRESILGRIEKSSQDAITYEKDYERGGELNTDEELDRSLEFNLPDKYSKVDLLKLGESKSDVEILFNTIKKVPPFSSLHYGQTASTMILKLLTDVLPRWFQGAVPEVQILSPQIRGSLGTSNLNKLIQERLNPMSENKKQIAISDRQFRIGDRVIQTRNNYDLNVFNGDIGKIIDLDLEERTALISFGADATEILYTYEQLMEIQLAYAITIHKSQGSEFPVVIMPVHTQHFNMLFRNLIYTGMTRAKVLMIFVGSQKALNYATKRIDASIRQTHLEFLCSTDCQ